MWDKMLKAYRDRPTIKNIMDTVGVGRRLAKRAVTEGWPDMSLPPFINLLSSGTSVLKEMAVNRESWEDKALVQGEAARMAAEQASAARITMSGAMKATQLSMRLAQEMVDRLDAGERLLPDELTPKVIGQIVKSMDISAGIVKKALEIEKLRAGEPEAQLGIQIGIMIEGCSLEELEVVASTGELPMRIIDQRKMAKARLADDETDAEASAIAAGDIIDVDEVDEPDELDVSL